MDSSRLVDFSNILQIGPRNLSDGDRAVLRGGSYGEVIVSELWGKYGELSRRGLVYAARSGAAAAIPINTTLTASPTLWNTASSGKLVVPLKVLFSAATLGTYVIDGFTVSYLLNAGDGVGTGAPVVTFTNLPPVNVLLGKGNSASTKFANATVTFTTQPAALMDVGLGQWLNGVAAVGQPYALAYDFDGAVMMPPGTTISIGAATAASSATYWTTILFAELPMPSQLP